MITYPCIVYPLTSHFYIVKLGFTTGVYRGLHYFLIFALNIDCGYSLEPPHRLSEAVLTCTHYPCFEQK